MATVSMSDPLKNLQREIESLVEHIAGITDPEKRRIWEDALFEKQMQAERLQGKPWSAISGLRYGPPPGSALIPSVTGYGTSYDHIPGVGSLWPGDTGGAWADLKVDVKPDGTVKVTNKGPSTIFTDNFISRVESGETPVGEAKAEIAHSKREKGVKAIMDAEDEVSRRYGTPTPRDEYLAATKAFQAEKAAIPEKAPTKSNLGDINVDDPYDPTGKRAKAAIAGVDFSGKFSRALPLGLGLGIGAALAPEEAWAAPFSQDGLNYWGGAATGLDLGKAAADPSRLSPFSIGATMAEDVASGLGQMIGSGLDTSQVGADIQPDYGMGGGMVAPSQLGLETRAGPDLPQGYNIPEQQALAAASAYPSMRNIYTDPTAMAYEGITPPGEEFGSSYAGPNTMNAQTDFNRVKAMFDSPVDFTKIAMSDEIGTGQRAFNDPMGYPTSDSYGVSQGYGGFSPMMGMLTDMVSAEDPTDLSTVTDDPHRAYVSGDEFQERMPAREMGPQEHAQFTQPYYENIALQPFTFWDEGPQTRPSGWGVTNTGGIYGTEPVVGGSVDVPDSRFDVTVPDPISLGKSYGAVPTGITDVGVPAPTYETTARDLFRTGRQSASDPKGYFENLKGNLGVGFTVGHGMSAKQMGTAPDDYRVNLPVSKEDLNTLAQAKLSTMYGGSLHPATPTGTLGTSGGVRPSELIGGTKGQFSFRDPTFVSSVIGNQDLLPGFDLQSGVPGGYVSLDAVSPHGDMLTAKDVSSYRPDLYGHHPSAFGIGDVLASKMADFTTVRKGMVPFSQTLSGQTVPMSDVLQGTPYSPDFYKDISPIASPDITAQATIDDYTARQIAQDMALPDEQQRMLTSNVPSVPVPAAPVSAPVQQDVINAQMVQEVADRQRQEQAAVDAHVAASAMAPRQDAMPAAPAGPTQAEIEAQIAAAEKAHRDQQASARQALKDFMASRAFQEEGASIPAGLIDVATQVDSFANIAEAGSGYQGGYEGMSGFEGYR